MSETEPTQPGPEEEPLPLDEDEPLDDLPAHPTSEGEGNAEQEEAGGGGEPA